MMGRPEFPNCIMTSGVIQRVRENQEAYDRDPAAYERREQARKEEAERERVEMEEQELEQYQPS